MNDPRTGEADAAENDESLADGWPFGRVADAIRAALLDDQAVERPVEEASQLAAEVAACRHEAARHFLGQLHQHCTMLAMAITDACRALCRLDRNLPFGAIVVVRGVAEAAADLYWLSDAQIDSVERTRRTFLTYLQQHETRVRQVIQFAERFPEEGIPPQAIDEGWQSLKVNAEWMATAGYELRSNKKPGARYSIGDPKPTISSLVDALITQFHGKTAINLYSGYSSVAHVEGGGLGSLLLLTDTITTPHGTRYRHGFDEATWRSRVLRPGVLAASGAAREWIRLAHPSRTNPYGVAIEQAVEGSE